MGCLAWYMASWAVGFPLSRLLLGPSWWRLSMTLRLGLSVALGSVYAGLVTFWALALIPAHRVAVVIVALAMGIMAGLAVIVADEGRSRRTRHDWQRMGIWRRIGWWGGALVFALVIALTWVKGLDIAVVSPEGHWDAWAMWMNRARFYFRSPLNWTRGFDPELEWAQPEYPSLLAGMVVYGWLPFGRSIALAPAIVSLSLQTSLFLMIVGLTQTAYPGRSWPWVLGIFYATIPNQWDPRLAWECADRPLALFLLVGVGALALAVRHRQRRWLLIAGFALGAAAFCKNEGKASLAILASGMAIGMLRAFIRGPSARLAAIKDLACLIIGLIPGLASLALQFAFSPLAPHMIRSIDSLPVTDTRRTSLILKSLWGQLQSPSWGGLWFGVAFTLLGLGIWLRRRELRLLWAAALLQLLVYLAFFQVTPLPLAWQLETAMPRLMMHVGPLFFLASGWLALSAERAIHRRPASSRVKNASEGQHDLLTSRIREIRPMETIIPGRSSETT